MSLQKRRIFLRYSFVQKKVEPEKPRLRSGKQYGCLEEKKTFLNNRYQDVLVHFKHGCKVYNKGRFLQTNVEGILLTSKMHIRATLGTVSVSQNRIVWRAEQVFLQ